MNKDIQYYKDLGVFNPFQIRVIQQGLYNNALDVSVYADPKFSYMQMLEIRWGLERGVDVTVYADPKFNYEQMASIRKMLGESIDPTEYITKITIEKL